MSGKGANKPTKRGGRFEKHELTSTEKGIQYLSAQRLTEEEAGIKEYTSPTVEGFNGIIKARYSDFHVNEINNSNEIAKLTDIKVPPDFYVNAVYNDDDKEGLKTLLSDDVVKQISELVASKDDEDLKVEIDAEKFSKDERCIIYDRLRAVFGRAIVANTITVDDKKVMVLKKFKSDGDIVDSRVKWPKNKGQYVYFIVYKEQLDTIETSFKISEMLKMNSSSFTYAGIKDRRAKTSQWFCAYKVDPKRLLLNTKPLTKVHVGNLTFHDEPLKLGQLNGNFFKVALRNVTSDDDLVSNAVNSIKENGFINYYGLQRFGNDKEVPTYEIGINLLLGKFKEACDLILKVKTSEDPNTEVGRAKRIYAETKDIRLASKQFKRQNNKCVESKLLLGFAKNKPNDYVNSLENIPRNMRLLYIHAFQSFVWNTVTSTRIKDFGLVPIEGDIVLLKENCDETVSDENIKILKKEDLELYTIYDIVLPLPGYDVQYPDNCLKESYKSILESYGLTLEMPKQSVKTYSLSGAYRKIICKPNNVSWKSIRYNHPDDTLIRSDYEELMGIELENQSDGQFKAIIIEFSLPPSAYATMCLRELLKMDTSSESQSKLNNYYTPIPLVEKPTSDTKEIPLDNGVTSDSLLADAEKYEEFKRQVFGMNFESEDSKRKLEDTEDSTSSVTKKSKTCSNGS